MTCTPDEPKKQKITVDMLTAIPPRERDDFYVQQLVTRINKVLRLIEELRDVPDPFFEESDYSNRQWRARHLISAAYQVLIQGLEDKEFDRKEFKQRINEG